MPFVFRAVPVLALLAGAVMAQTAAPAVPPDIASLKPRAEAGEIGAMIALGHAYEDGAGVPQNNVEAVKWYRKAAGLGNAEAQNDLGVMYRIGHGVDKDFAEAMKWYRLAARQAYANAMFNLGTHYYNGDGVKIDDAMAYAWFSAAAQGGNRQAAEAVLRMTTELPRDALVEAKLSLADLLLKEEAGPKNATGAISILNELAASGDPRVLVRLAKIYVAGDGLAVDRGHAEQYCAAAARKKYTAAMVCLGYLNQIGISGTPDFKAARSWYEKAVRDGSPIAMYGLATMYAHGDGVPKDLQKSFMYAVVAAHDRVGPAIDLADRIKAKLAPDLSAKPVG